jgi:hypothetical protein
MISLSPDSTHGAPRRSLFGRVAGAAALGLAGLLPTLSGAQAAAPEADGPLWPGRLKGRHRQVVDAYDVNNGSPLAFAYTFLTPNGSPGAATAVVVLRHGAFPIALNNAMWTKYKVGETLKIIDPETKAPALKNPFLHPKPGVLTVDDMAIDQLLEKGTIFGACRGVAGPEQKAGEQRRRERRRRGKGMGRERSAGDHDPPVGNMGCEPRARSRLHILRGWRLISCSACSSQFRGAWSTVPVLLMRAWRNTMLALGAAEKQIVPDAATKAAHTSSPRCCVIPAKRGLKSPQDLVRGWVSDFAKRMLGSASTPLLKQAPQCVDGGRRRLFAGWCSWCRRGAIWCPGA